MAGPFAGTSTAAASSRFSRSTPATTTLRGDEQRTATRSAASCPSKSSKLRSEQPSAAAMGRAYFSVMPTGLVISAK
jgi:hypothetical protein